MTQLQRLADRCVIEALRHKMHTNLRTETLHTELVYIVSERVISISFVLDGKDTTETIVNNNKSSTEDVILDYLEKY